MVALLLLLATGCGDEGDVKATDSPAWRTSTDPVVTSGLAWAAGSTVHLSDGTTIDTGGFVRSFVVAGDGAFFVPAESEEDAGSTTLTVDELRFATPGKPATGTGLQVSPQFVAGSPDGRYLAAIDTTTGEKDRFDTPQASVVAFDLKTGKQVIDSTLGMGDPDEDDLADAYSEAEMEILSMTDTSLYVRALGEFVFDLATGEGRELEEGERPQAADLHSSPNGEWRIEGADEGRIRIVGADGAEVTPVTEGPRWNLSWWADDRTAVGTYITGPNTGIRTQPGDSVALMTCQVPSGECEVFEESAGQTVVFPYGATAGNGMVLQGGDES